VCDDEQVLALTGPMFDGLYAYYHPFAAAPGGEMSRERPAPRPVDTAGGADDAADGPGHGIGLGEATRVWGLVALNSFGGPAGQIAVMHRFLIEDRRWFSEKRFLHSLNYCMLLPGPEAQQLATYFGWLLHGVRGGLIAGGLFVLPGFVAIMILSVLYAGFGDVAAVEAIFYGIKPAVMAIVAAAVVRIGSRALKNLRRPALHT
jgi:chromate transporter